MKKVLIVMVALCLGLAPVAQAGDGELLYKSWIGVSGINNDLESLKNNAAYPNSPTGTAMVTVLGAEEGSQDYWGGEITGYLIPPATGDFTFWVASDDDGEFWLSPSGNPAQRVQICSVEGWCPRYDWDGTAGSPGTNQDSAPQRMYGNRKYSIMLRWSDGTGGGYGDVAWQGPKIATRVQVAAPYITTVGPSTHVTTNPTPANGTTGVDPTTNLTLTWSAPVAPPTPVAQYKVYFSTNDVKVGEPNSLVAAYATVNAGSPLQVTVPESQLDYNKMYYWRVDTICTVGAPATDPNNAVGDLWRFQAALTIPVIVSQPARQIVDPGGTATFVVGATGDPLGGVLRYQWYHGTTLMTGETGDTLVIAGVDDGDTGNYNCVVTNNAGSSPSAAAALIVKHLVAWYPLDGDVMDYSGLGPDGTIWGVGAADPNAMFSVGLPALNGCIGVNVAASRAEYVVFGDVGITGNMPRSITCWARNSVPQNEITDWCNIFGFTSDAGTAEMSFDFNKRGGTDQYCIHRYGAEWSMGTIDGQWHFLAATFIDGVVKWYFDGRYGGQASTNLQTQPKVHLGKRGTQSGNTVVWRGWVDDARVYNYPLTDLDVALMYTAIDTDAMVCVGGNPAADFSGDCKVDLADLVVLASDWLECNIVPDCKP